MSNSVSTNRLQEYLSSIPQVTVALLCINIGVHGLIFVTGFPQHALAINPVLVIVEGDYYRLVTSAFVHGGVLHILMNMSSLLALGTVLENKYGSMRFLILTALAIMLTGCTFVTVVWLYSMVTFDPRALNNSAVGYSGVLFCYALIESFHSPAPSRSVYGFFSVPTRWYPFILLVIIQVILPNISLFGHLSGLLVGILLISDIGSLLFIPSHDCLSNLEQSRCCARVSSVGSYVPLRDAALEHPSFTVLCLRGSTGNSTGICASIGSIILVILQQLWSLLSTAMHIIGISPQRLESCCVWAYSRCSSPLAIISATANAASTREPASEGEDIELLGGSEDSGSANRWSSNPRTLRDATAASILPEQEAVEQVLEV